MTTLSKLRSVLFGSFFTSLTTTYDNDVRRKHTHPRSFYAPTMATTQRQVLQLYKSLLKESKKFPSYNFRHYAVRKVKDSFRANKNMSDPNQIRNKIEEGTRNLEVIKRQVIIGQMYATDKLVIENVSRIRVNG